MNRKGRWKEKNILRGICIVTTLMSSQSQQKMKKVKDSKKKSIKIASVIFLNTVQKEAMLSRKHASRSVSNLIL